METFGMRLMSVVKTEAIGIVTKIAIISIISSFIFNLSNETLVLIATIFLLFILIQKSLFYISNQFLLEMLYYLGIVYGIVYTAWTGDLKAEGNGVYLVSALLGYLLYKIFDTYKLYSIYTDIEKDVLNKVIEQLDKNDTISIHAIYQQVFMSKDEIIRTIKAQISDGKIPSSIEPIDIDS